MPGPEPKDADVDILRAIALQPSPFVIAKDLEEDLTVGVAQIHNRLDDLVEEGFLNHRKAGYTDIYWISDEGREML